MATKKRTKGAAKNKKTFIDNDSLSGFTIIEVVLVLAIAGLIFLMVFIALPQLQRAQRDTQRRNDLGRLAGAITQYQTNNNGKIPTQTCTAAGGCLRSEDFIKRYVIGVNGTEDDFADPLGTPYTIEFSGTAPTNGGEAYQPNAELNFKIYMYGNAKCDGEQVISAGDNRPRNYAIQYRLEGSGTYCADNAG